MCCVRSADDWLAHRLIAFERRYEKTAQPFEWKFTRADLVILMNKLADKEDDAKEAA